VALTSHYRTEIFTGFLRSVDRKQSFCRMKAINCVRVLPENKTGFEGKPKGKGSFENAWSFITPSLFFIRGCLQWPPRLDRKFAFHQLKMLSIASDLCPTNRHPASSFESRAGRGIGQSIGPRRCGPQHSTICESTFTYHPTLPRHQDATPKLSSGN